MTTLRYLKDPSSYCSPDRTDNYTERFRSGGRSESLAILYAQKSCVKISNKLYKAELIIKFRI